MHCIYLYMHILYIFTFLSALHSLPLFKYMFSIHIRYNSCNTTNLGITLINHHLIKEHHHPPRAQFPAGFFVWDHFSAWFDFGVPWVIFLCSLTQPSQAGSPPAFPAFISSFHGFSCLGTACSTAQPQGELNQGLLWFPLKSEMGRQQNGLWSINTPPVLSFYPHSYLEFAIKIKALPNELSLEQNLTEHPAHQTSAAHPIWASALKRRKKE